MTGMLPSPTHRFAGPVTVREVGPRDGLQAEAPLALDHRVALIERLLAAGVTHVEIGAFVSPTAVPAMRDAARVVELVGPRPGVVRTALVPNVRGAGDALAARVDELTVTVSASAVYNERNVRRTIEQSMEEVRAIVSLAADVARPSPPSSELSVSGLAPGSSPGSSPSAVVPVDVVMSCAFGSPYEGDIAPTAVAALCRRLRELGADAITLADTTGMATPRRIDEVLALVGIDVGLHLHDTRGTGLLNLYAGLQAGVRRFDTSVGGLGGSPFAAGASGNVATEDAIALLDDLGLHSGVDLARLVETARWLETLIGHRLASRVAYAGPRLDPARSPLDPARPPLTRPEDRAIGR
jgi:hydroxymethylglutaryl-CoA lyase